MKTLEVVIAIINRADGRILISRRRRNDSWGGYWEFPGGKQERGESHHDCLARELLEELAVRVRVAEPLDVIECNYPGTRIRLHPYLCEYTEGDAQPLASDEVAWVLPADLPRYQFPPANKNLIRNLVARFCGL
jgi:mutator protein MutT